MKNEIESVTCARPSSELLYRFHRRIAAKTADSSEPSVLIVALGDSVTSGAGLPGQYFHEEVYHAQFKRLLQARFPTCMFSVINASDDGRDAPSGVLRLERDVLHHQPDLLLVGYGLNDAGARGWEGIEQYGEALEAMVCRTREATQASIILLTPNMMPTRDNDNVPLEYRDLVERFVDLQNAGVLAAYAEKVREVGALHGVAVVDVYGAWEELHESGVDTTAMLINGLNHPNPAGHTLAAKCLMHTIELPSTSITSRATVAIGPFDEF